MALDNKEKNYLRRGNGTGSFSNQKKNGGRRNENYNALTNTTEVGKDTKNQQYLLKRLKAAGIKTSHFARSSREFLGVCAKKSGRVQQKTEKKKEETAFWKHG